MIYADSQADVQLSYVSLEGNFAVREGGALYVVTDSRFILKVCTFIKNYARDASAIYASTLNPDYEFEINNCLFNSNRAVQNTLSLFNAYGTIDRSIFSNNFANLYSENIFLGFSEVTINDSKFFMDR